MRRPLATIFLVSLCALLLPASAAAQLVSLGPSFRVNATTAGTQSKPVVASSPDGSFVVVWQSEGAPGDPAVRARRYDRTGVPLGGEMVVSGTTPVFHSGPVQGAASPGPTRLTPAFSAPPAVAMNAAGEFLVVWAGPAGAIDIRARLFRRTGTPAGPEIVVNTTTAGDQALPAVAALAGGFVVVWSTPSFADLHGRLLDESGQPASAELAIVEPASGLNFGAAVAPGAGGGFVVAWTGEGAGDPDRGIRARRFDAQGSGLGPAFLVNTTVAGSQGDASVAADTAGNFLVTWASGDELTVPPELDVMAQRFASDGQPIGGELRVNDTVAATQAFAATALDESGGAAVVWESSSTGVPATEGLFAKLYASSGPSLVNETRLALEGTDPALAADFGGDFVVVATDGDGQATGISARRFTRACEPRGHNLCLQNGRFKVEAAWRTNQGANGLGFAQALTTDTGYLYFFNPANVELVVKVLNGCPVNNRFWVFAGGLTNVEVDLVVTDTLTGSVRRYLNPPNTSYQPIQDTAAFATCDAPATASETATTLGEAEEGEPDTGSPVLGPEARKRARQAARAERRELARLLARLDAAVESARHEEALPRAIAGSCTPSATRLCLRSGRFSITVDWLRPDGIEGQGKGVPLTSDTGYFWFFSPANVEMLIKVLNGCPVNSRYWVFAGGLTNVRAEITVTDTATGAQKTYVNPQQTPFQPILDTGAFLSCP